ncbi:MAG: metal-dependent transcriptional regulator [Lacibacter sp.]
MVFSAAEENYIKAIWKLQKDNTNVTTNALSEALNTKPASVTDMLKRLKDKKILKYFPYYGVQLNAEGQQAALLIIRRHRLWEYFLAEKLKFDWDAVHPLAEELEHINSPELTNRLDAYLGYPQIDPHGDPIPNIKGQMPVTTRIALADFPLNQPAVVSGVLNQSSELLELLKHKKITIGATIEICRRFEFDGSIEIQLQDLPLITLSFYLSQNILVKPIQP